jgi:RNA-directed DNA polymerase
MVFDQIIWDEFEQKALSLFPKKYTHFDRPFEINTGLAELKKMLQGLSAKKVAQHPFLPFLKIIIKTPRFRYQEELSKYELQTKERPISFAGHFDALLISYFDLVLKKKYQAYVKAKGFSDSVLAYRDDLDGRCNIQFAGEIFDWIKDKCKNGEAYTAIGFDVKGYFDTIPHQELKCHWQTVLNQNRLDADTFAVFKALTNYSYVYSDSLKKHFNYSRPSAGQCLLDMMPEKLTGGHRMLDKFAYLRSRNLIVQNDSVLHITEPDHPLGVGDIRRGIPQGSPISATLSNVYLIEFDLHMSNFCNSMGSIYRRYCDDILIVCKSKNAISLNNRLLTQLYQHGLKVQPLKTEIINFRKVEKHLKAFDGKTGSAVNRLKKLQYLGFEFDGERTYIRPGSLSTYFRKMKAGIRNTVLKVYGQHSKNSKILVKDLLEKYSHTGKNNFIAYAYRAASLKYGRGAKAHIGLNSPSIKRQLRRHFTILLKELEKENDQRYAIKLKEYNWNLVRGNRVKPIHKKSSKA